MTTDANGEVPFFVEELFFSRTDERGIIQFGNSIFRRVSGYSWDELHRRPHNIIRHADMPKAVFWLLWDTIKRGEPIGAYVKNRAKDGRHYWVLAIVTPVEGGFLSVRLKPTSDLLPIIEQEYGDLSALEKEQRLKPEESAQLLLKRLSELGFRDYGTFMAAALRSEIISRDRELRRPANRSIGNFDKLAELAQSMLRQAAAIFDAYADNEHVPLNLRVHASKLGQNGATIGVISTNYNSIAEEIKFGMKDFIRSANEVFDTINRGGFLFSVAQIQVEVLAAFAEETSEGELSNEIEVELLDHQQVTYRNKAMTGLDAIAEEFQRFHESCREMQRLAAGLEVTRVMGKVETARLSETVDGLVDLIGELERFQRALAEGLEQIHRINRFIQRSIQELLHMAA